MAVQVGVHVARFQGVALPISRIVLKQVLAGNVLALAHQPGQAGIPQGHVVRHAFLAHEGKVDLATLDGYVFIAQGSQAVAFVLLRVLLVADPDEGLVHEQQHQGHHFITVQGRAAQVFVALRPQWGQLFAKGAQARELGQAAHFVPGRVVAVLLAAQAIEARHLQVRGGRGRNPDLRPGRRNHEAGDAVQGFRVGDFQALGIVVGKIAGAGGSANQARALVGGVAQAGHPGLAGGVFVEDVGFLLGHQGLLAGFGAGSGRSGSGHGLRGSFEWFLLTGTASARAVRQPFSPENCVFAQERNVSDAEEGDALRCGASLAARIKND